jgi:glycosyltransferase involved in cell wall biosynthesis
VRSALLVSYYFPPRFSIGGKRAHRFARYLPEHGFRATVLTAPAPHGERLDPSFTDRELAPSQVRREYLTAAEVAAMPRAQLGSDGTLEAPTTAWFKPAQRRGVARVRAALRWTPPIGPTASQLPRLVARIIRLARESSAEVIFATGTPWEAIVASTVAGRALRLPVVVDFRDPWSFGPVMSRRPAWVQMVDRLIERGALASAAALTVTTEAARDRYASMGAARRVVLIRNGFDPSTIVTPKRDERVTLIHFGNCYGERALAPFLRAMAAVIARRGLRPGAIRMLNLGRAAAEDLALARELGISDFFEFQTVLPYAQGIDLVSGADLALLPSFGDEPWFLPGKLYDYLLARTPVLGVTTSPELGRILARTKLGWTVSPSDTAQLEHRIEQAVEARAEGRPLVQPDEAAIEAMSARATAGELARLLEDVIRS